jgi:hypothetical protein
MQLFKKIIILFWTLWWLIALWTDIVGVLKHLRWLDTAWASDANYLFLVDSLKIYSPPSWLPQLLLGGIIVWSLTNASFFIYACLAFRQNEAIWIHRASTAFIISLCFWLALFLADQVVMKFFLEANHMVQGMFELVTFLCLYLLPDKDRGLVNAKASG